MIFVEQAIPCILHMENRIGEKMLKLLLIDGSNERNSNKKELSEKIARVNRLSTLAFLVHHGVKTIGP